MSQERYRNAVARAARMCPVPLPNSASCTTFLFYLQMMDRALALPTVSGALFCDWFTRNVRAERTVTCFLIAIHQFAMVVLLDVVVSKLLGPVRVACGLLVSHTVSALWQSVRRRGAAAETLPAAAQSLTFALPVVMEMRLTAIPPGSTLDLFVLFLWVAVNPCASIASHMMLSSVNPVSKLILHVSTELRFLQ